MSATSPPAPASQSAADRRRALFSTPIADRPAHGTWWNALCFPLLFNLGMLGINSAQFCALPLLLVPFVGRRWFEAVIDWTKDGFGRLLILITVLFAPTSIHLSATTPPHLAHVVQRDAQGRVTGLNLPDRLVIMANHQAYTDWMYLWVLACYAGHARGIVILLKWALRGVPIVGWGMRFFRFIFMKRSWAADRHNLTLALTRLGRQARASGEEGRKQRGTGADGSAAGDAGVDADKDEDAPLLAGAGAKSGRSPLWLLIFPEGTITSDEERAKSVRYAEREGIDDFVTTLHPRSTGLLFCLRTLLPQVPDLQLLDVTIGYPGVPLGKYPQDYYGLGSIFFRGVPPPSVHMHFHLHDNLSSPDCPIPSLIPKCTPADTGDTITAGTAAPAAAAAAAEDPGLATPDEARAFELWLRKTWTEKEKRMVAFHEHQAFPEEKDGVEVFAVRQVRWYHWLGAMGGGGAGTLAALGLAIWGGVYGATR